MTGLIDQIEAAIRRGLAFLLAHQALDGSWTDWALPPGSSPDWTTAYVGLRLTALRPPFRAALQALLDRAGRWLLARRAVEGGWAYNPAVEEDADSTSLALLFLAALAHLIHRSERLGTCCEERTNVTTARFWLAGPLFRPYV
jgi:prenyltransferase beta subunit